MKVFAVLATIATVALAAPHQPGPPPPPPGSCEPATYDCAVNPDTGAAGWKVCDVDHTWRYGGDCPPSTYCYFYPPSKSPYCLP